MKARIRDRRVEYAWTRVQSLPRRPPGAGDMARPHHVSAYSAPASWLKVLYVFVDNWIGWIRRVVPMKNEGTLLLIDRGWWDMAVDQRRYKLQRSAWLVRFLGRFAPRPDVVIILQAPTAVILERKAELGADELQRQMDLWRQVLPRRVQQETLDVARSFAAVADELERLLRELLEQER